MSFSKIPKHGESAPKEAHTNNNNFDQRIDAIRQRNIIDSKFGYELYTECCPKNGWLVNVQQSEVVDEKTKVIQSVVNFYFLESCGGRFKISYLFRPYLYLETVPGSEFAVAEFLSRKYHFVQVEHVEKENLDLV
uniref:DNA polymerase epsilon catalytic subunit n=1 Tax=Meloidogyne incognita TaxID=6306 RepID=A0A914N4B1_MELIC